MAGITANAELFYVGFERLVNHCIGSEWKRDRAAAARLSGSGYRQANLSESYRIGAMVPTDNGALEVGRPSCIGPGSCHEQVGNRTALDGPV